MRILFNLSYLLRTLVLTAFFFLPVVDLKGIPGISLLPEESTRTFARHVVIGGALALKLTVSPAAAVAKLVSRDPIPSLQELQYVRTTY